MNDLYVECYVKVLAGTNTAIKKTLMIALAVIAAFVAIFVIPHILTLAIAAVIVCVVIWRLPLLKVDYEYVFVDGQLDFDKIMGGEKRKHMLRIDFDDLVVVAPEKSHALDGYKDAQEYDFSANNPEMKNYMIVVSKGEKRMKICFSPNEKLLQAMKSKSRSKIVEV